MPTPLPDSQLCIRRMTPSDVPAALRLTVQAGWNQTPGDWLRMLDMEPQGCFMAEVDGVLVGTTVCCTFDEIAWLALVLVDVAFRERGIGRGLVQAGLKSADDHGVRTVRLDATPLGRPVYERLGFQPQFELSRWGGLPNAAVAAVSPQNTGVPDVVDFERLCELDRLATGTNRTKLLERLFAESPPEVAWNLDGQLAGSITRRPGRLATQIGPCYGSSELCRELLRRELRAYQGQPVIVDIPVDKADLNAVASEAGLTVQRTLLRMYRGTPVVENPEWFQISSGAELG